MTRGRAIAVQEKIAVVTDSTSDLTPEMLAKYNIHSLPLKVIYRDQTYHDRIDITPQEVCQRMDEEIPTTSMPSPYEILQLLESLKKKGFTHAICLHISGGLSSTCETVRNMAAQIKDLTVEVIDSKSLSLGLGMQAIEVARNLAENIDFHGLVERAKAMVPQSKAFFVVKTLDYLRKGGRIGYVTGTIGELLQIKPIISINEEGKYYNVDHARGRAKSMDKLYEIVKATIEAGMSKVAIAHSDCEEEARSLLERLQKLPNVKETFFTELSPVMVVHAGPGLVGAVVAP